MDEKHWKRIMKVARKQAVFYEERSKVIGTKGRSGWLYIVDCPSACIVCKNEKG
jgi:hypothetical protein